jgi:hypothetical protein
MTNEDTGEVEWYHIEFVTVTIEIERIVPMLQLPVYREHLPGAAHAYAVIDSPVCTYWHEIIPNHCDTLHLVDWKDNGDGHLSVCDTIYFEGDPEPWHVVDVATDIGVTPDPTAGVGMLPYEDPSVDNSTWGRIKSLYR